MSGYIILIIATAILAITAYKLFNNDFLAPSFIVSVMYFSSTVAAFLAKVLNLWNNVNLDLKVVMLVLVGIISFIIGEYLIRKIIGKVGRRTPADINNSNKVIKITNIKMIIIYVFLLLTFCNIFYQMVNITGINDNIPEMINAYRDQTPIFNKDNSTTSIDTFAMQMYRATDLFALFFTFIIINNVLLKDKIKNNIRYLIPVLICTIIALLVSGRTPLFKLLVSGVFIGIILYRKYYNKDLTLKGFLKIVLLFFAIVLPIFYLIMPLIGREQSTDMVSYLTFYLGSPIPSFSEIIDSDAIDESKYFGQYSFTGIQSFANRFFPIEGYSPYSSTWIDFNGLYSNVFTGLKNYYLDFGILGVIVLQLVFAIIMTYIYTNVNKKRFNLIFFSFFCIYILIDQYRGEKVFSGFVSLDSVIYFVYMIIIYAFLFKNIKDLKMLFKQERE